MQGTKKGRRKNPVSADLLFSVMRMVAAVTVARNAAAYTQRASGNYHKTTACFAAIRETLKIVI